MEDALSSKMKPVHESVAKIEKKVNEEVQKVQENVTEKVGSQMSSFTTSVKGLKKDVSNHMTEIKDQLTSRVDTVAKKVPALDTLNTSISNSATAINTHVTNAVGSSKTRVSKMLEEFNKKLDSISSSLEKPSNKGARAERRVIDILRMDLQGLNYTFLDTAREPGKGDVEVQTPSGHKIMIEVKQWKGALSKDAIEEFERNLANASHFKVGILLSMTSGIARRSREGRFEISFNQSQKQFQIYVPNAYANNDEHLIVWSVVMADQLAKLDGDLGDRKTKELNEIYKKFAENVQHSKDCKASLLALENSVNNLKNSIEPILKTVDETSNAINKLLHPS